MYYDCLLLCFLFYHLIQCSREKNNMSVSSEVALYCIPVYCVQHIEIDHLSKHMVNKKRKKVRIHNCCLFTWYDLVQLSHTITICYQMLQYYGAEQHCKAEWGLNSSQDMENIRNRLTHNSINKSVIYVKMEL